MTKTNISTGRKTSQRQIAEEAGKLANGKIASLQRRYTGSGNAGSAQARAELARLRRLNPSQGRMWFSVGASIFEQWPHGKLADLGALGQDEERVAKTVEDALGLYALHQQSMPRGCAVVRGRAEDDESFARRVREGSLGCACRLIERDLSKASNVQRRLAAMESAADYEGVLYGLRMLVGLMKHPKDRDCIPLDYRQLAEDLYLIQLSGRWRTGVIARWARDYFTYEGDKHQER